MHGDDERDHMFLVSDLFSLVGVHIVLSTGEPTGVIIESVVLTKRVLCFDHDRSGNIVNSLEILHGFLEHSWRAQRERST